MGTGGSSLPSSPLWLYTLPFGNTHTFLLSPKTNNYIANLLQISFIFFISLWARKNYRIFFQSKRVRILKLFSQIFFWDQALDLLVSVSYYITAGTPPTYQPGCLPGVLPAYAVGYLILKRVSRLDAFSVYLNRTPLLCYAAGATTDAQLVRSSRSSRTKDKPSQVSYAHDG